jgi:AcrR family transcriptional regulator
MARPAGDPGRVRERLIEAAGRGFRVGGYGGAGVDGLAREAGLTSGAFYAHLGSKAEAFRLALISGLTFLREGIDTFKQRHGADWVVPFVEFYFGERMAAPLAQACALPTLTTDAARSDEATRLAYEAELEQIATTIAEGLTGGDTRARAWALLALLAGGASMARAVSSGSLRQEIIAAVSNEARRT